MKETSSKYDAGVKQRGKKDLESIRLGVQIIFAGSESLSDALSGLTWLEIQTLYSLLTFAQVLSFETSRRIFNRFSIRLDDDIRE